ncbi:MAG: response regulator [Desulfobacteraceae bacterium]|nr:MAG: response regulator [Desulfobacteraceae bacterium]
MFNVQDLRILLVDDEADFRAAISRRLSRRGIRPEEAGGGEACLEKLASIPMDVVILDVKMPGMDGIEVLKRIKEKHPETEVILLTGQASARDGVDGIKAGAFDYLTKPIEFEHLIGKIEQAYERILNERARKETEDFKSKMAQQMIVCERLASLGTLAAGVAHEINNPLAIIGESAGWMSQLLRREELSEFPRKADFSKALGKIESAIERARRITHQLLGFVKSNEPAAFSVDLAELAGEARELMAREAKNKQVEIVLQAARGCGDIWSDPYSLRQVLINLLSNALHATAPGGQIVIAIEDEGNCVRVGVEDTGSGIPKENLDKIFEPFFSTKKPGEGTGLGLFVARGIIEKLGGTITVKSTLGKGATFSIRLPKCAGPKEPLT